jgi:hypothetical protein
MNTERIRLHKEIAKAVNEVFNDDKATFYIPAGRSLLTLMFNQKTKIDYESLDFVTRDYVRLIESIQSRFDRGIEQVHVYYPSEKRSFDIPEFAKLITSRLKGNYHYSNGQEYLHLEDGTKIKINFASSGQQEVLWLLLQLYVLLLKEEKAFVIIEEPEAHLYPTLQKHIFDYIISFANLNSSEVLITTHSPYILMAANNLYKAGVLRNSGKKEQVNKLLGKGEYINPSELTAVKLLASGKYENLIDEDFNDLKTSLIDDISDQINETYTKLFYMEENADDSM